MEPCFSVAFHTLIGTPSIAMSFSSYFFINVLTEATSGITDASPDSSAFFVHGHAVTRETSRSFSGTLTYAEITDTATRTGS